MLPDICEALCQMRRFIPHWRVVCVGRGRGVCTEQSCRFLLMASLRRITTRCSRPLMNLGALAALLRGLAALSRRASVTNSCLRLMGLLTNLNPSYCPHLITSVYTGDEKCCLSSMLLFCKQYYRRPFASFSLGMDSEI